MAGFETSTEAVTEVSVVSISIVDMKSESWREATQQARKQCEETLADLNAHRKEHGC